MWLVAGWKETSISSDLWVESLKNKEIGFQNNCPCLEMCRGIGKLNFTYSCLSGLRPEHRTGAFLILKNWPSAPCPNIEKFSFDSGETFLIGQSKIPQNRQASKVPGGGGGGVPCSIVQEQGSAFSTLCSVFVQLALSALAFEGARLPWPSYLAFEPLWGSSMESRFLP